jgi:hypothetical protein
MRSDACGWARATDTTAATGPRIVINNTSSWCCGALADVSPQRYRKLACMVCMYTAECYWPGITEEKLQRAAARKMQAAEAVAQQGVRVRYLGAVLFPEDQVVLFEFDSVSADAVQRVSDQTELDVARIIASLRIQGSHQQAS